MRLLENRIPPPALFMLVAFLMWLVSRDEPQLFVSDEWRLLLTAVLVIVSIAMGLPAIDAFRRAKTTINPVTIAEASSLVTTGVFSISRNPMYVSLSLLLTCWAVQLGTFWAAVGPVAFVTFISRFQIVPEERILAAKFGRAYAAYRARVRRWL